VVLFNTKWSDRCRQMTPVVDQLAKQNVGVKFLKVLLTYLFDCRFLAHEHTI
jgi:thioredoxin-like negative regulator of GroEL